MRLTATTIFPHAMAFAAARDPEATRIEGEITAKESRAMGFQWLFYPDADVNNNPDNPIINIRSVRRRSGRSLRHGQRVS